MKFRNGFKIGLVLVIFTFLFPSISWGQPVGSLDIKSSAIGELEGAKIGDKKIDKKLDDAIEHIDKSLKNDLREDKSHLDPKHGKKVFEEEKKAVKKLMGVIKKKDTPPDVAEICDDIISMIVEADERLADAAFEDASVTLEEISDPKVAKKVEKELEKCAKEFEKAEEDLDKENYDKAIDHYKKAWEHAQKALKELRKLEVEEEDGPE